MANDAAPEELINISRQPQVQEDMAPFYLQETFSDVVLVFPERTVYAHKIVLAARCKHFKSLLLDKPDMNQIAVNDVPLETFLIILKYIYTGSLSLPMLDQESIFNVLKVAHEYTLDDLEARLSKQLKTYLNCENYWLFLNQANELEIWDLREACHAYFEEHCLSLSSNKEIHQLTQKSMVKLLDALKPSVPEINIFRIVQTWLEENKDVDDLVLKRVNLEYLSNEEVLSEVFPSKLMDDSTLLNLIAERANKKSSVLSKKNVEKRPSVSAKLDEHKDPKLMAKQPELAGVPSSSTTSRRSEDTHLDNLVGPGKDWILLSGSNRKTTFYHPSGSKEGITLYLGNYYSINHIKMKLDDDTMFSYFVETSLDCKDWKMVVNYKSYDCRSFQNLYFPKMKAAYVRIVLGQKTPSNSLYLADLGVYLTTWMPRLLHNIVVPVKNVASQEMGAFVRIGNRRGKYNTQHLIDSKELNWTVCQLLTESIVVQLAQPYVVSKIKLLLPNTGSFRYVIETSVNGGSWSLAVDNREKDCSDWQILQFSKRIAVYIRITGTKASYSWFQCSGFECPYEFLPFP